MNDLPKFNELKRGLEHILNEELKCGMENAVKMNDSHHMRCHTLIQSMNKNSLNNNENF